MQKVENRADDLLALADDAFLIARAFDDARDEELARAAEAVLTRFIGVSERVEELLIALQRLKEAIPKQDGGRGKITAQSRRKALHSFASEIRDLWTQRGLSLGGNGEPDDGFGDFLLAVYNAVTREAKKKLPNEGALLAELRNDWPGCP